MDDAWTGPASVDEALRLMASCGAPPRLLRHGGIVAQVAGEISRSLDSMGVGHDARLVTVGAALHDVGKVVHPDELVGPGRRHEAAGEQLLLGIGLSPALARVCRTHGEWAGEDVTMEDRLIACADHLWKGSRDDSLERLVFADVASRLGVDVWEALLRIDPVFERVASGGTERLARAQA